MHLKRLGATTLAELCVALVIGFVAAAVGGGVLMAAERHARRDRESARESQAVRDVAHVLATEIASARAGSIAIRGDTAMDIASHVGASVACRVGALELVLPSVQTSLAAPYSSWRLAPEVGDQLAIWDTTAGGAWASARIDSVSSRSDGAGCSADGAFRSAADSIARRAVTWIRVSPPLSAGVARGAPVRVFRELRWMLYRSADRSWWLGMRRCTGACTAAQPVAGPLAAPNDSGLVFARSGAGEVTITLRAPSSAGAAARATSRITAAARGDWRARD